MNTSPNSSPDATPEPLPPETAAETPHDNGSTGANSSDASSSEMSSIGADLTNKAASEGDAPTRSWEQARAELDAFLGNDDEASTVFDEEIEDSDDDDYHADYDDEHESDGIDIEEIDDEDDEVHAAGYVEPRGSRWPAVLILLLIVGGIGGTMLYSKNKAEAKEARRWAAIAMPDEMAFVPTDWGAQTLGDKLKASGKIRDVDAFVESAREADLTSVMPGGYALPETAGPRDLAKLFKAGPTHEKAVFPPGFTGIQVVDRLKREGFAAAGDVEKLVYPAQGFSPYEGTLAPGTYWMPLGAGGKKLVTQMQEEFAQMVKKLPQPLPTVNGKELTIGEVTTIASLVERESNLKDEMPKVAGVIINRLQKPMRLQIDASVQYARIMADKDHKTRLYFEDYKFKSPFNTYLNDGLPPTPICNPGENALMAAARPTKTSALFYVYSPKLKKHVFADDFQGHKNNVARARRERDAIERAKS